MGIFDITRYATDTVLPRRDHRSARRTRRRGPSGQSARSTAELGRLRSIAAIHGGPRRPVSRVPFRSRDACHHRAATGSDAVGDRLRALRGLSRMSPRNSGSRTAHETRRGVRHPRSKSWRRSRPDWGMRWLIVQRRRSLGLLGGLLGAVVGCRGDAPAVPSIPPVPQLDRVAKLALDSLGPERADAAFAVSPEGHLAFTRGFDPTGRQITIVDAQGRLLARVGRTGQGPGELSRQRVRAVPDRTPVDGDARVPHGHPE